MPNFLTFYYLSEDMFHCIHPNACFLVADDTTLLNSHKYIDTLENPSNLSVEKAVKWFSTSKLNLIGKIKQIFII